MQEIFTSSCKSIVSFASFLAITGLPLRPVFCEPWCVGHLVSLRLEDWRFCVQRYLLHTMESAVELNLTLSTLGFNLGTSPHLNLKRHLSYSSQYSLLLASDFIKPMSKPSQSFLDPFPLGGRFVILHQPFFKWRNRSKKLCCFAILNLEAIEEIRAFSVKRVEGSWKWLGDVEAATSWRHDFVHR